MRGVVGRGRGARRPAGWLDGTCLRSPIRLALTALPLLPPALLRQLLELGQQVAGLQAVAHEAQVQAQAQVRCRVPS